MKMPSARKNLLTNPTIPDVFPVYPKRRGHSEKNLPMKKILFPLLLSFPMFLLHCSKDEIIVDPGAAPVVTLDCTESPQVCQLSRANNAFGFHIFRKLHEAGPRENSFISPFSIGTALAMTLNGAAGQTRVDMHQTMQLGAMEMNDVNSAYQTLLTALPAMDPGVEVLPANSIWYREGYPVEEDFLNVNRQSFFSEVNAVDFTDPAAKDLINGWVDSKTRGLINKIIDEVPSNIVMYLINAVYFKGAWTKAFNPEDTYETPFYLASGGETQVKMMSFGGVRLPYFATSEFQSVDLDYGDGVFAMSIFLPNEDITMDEAIAAVESVDWEILADAYQRDSILFGMPRFKMEYEETLNEVLIALGMEKAFTPGVADFSKISAAGGLNIDQVKHKAFIEVNEEGTEAAAVTSIGIVETSVPTIPDVIVNRPFLFVIRDKATNGILFVGKMMNPNGR